MGYRVVAWNKLKEFSQRKIENRKRLIRQGAKFTSEISGRRLIKLIISRRK
jgi:hypothetical protein